MLQRERDHQSLQWNKTLQGYYRRDEWELFDLKYDPLELYNVAAKRRYKVQRRIDTYVKRFSFQIL